MTTYEKLLLTSQQLFFEKGYSNTSVQNIIDAVGIAKGTFYHYFKSKHTLLEELTDRLVASEIQRTSDYLKQSDDDAITKLNHIHHTHIAWKAKNLEMLYVVFQAMYSEANNEFRLMMQEKSNQMNLPLYNQLIHQGVKEGSFDTPYPDLVGRLILKIGLDFSDELSHILLHYKEYDHPFEEAKRNVEFMFHTMERLLGTYEGSVEVIDTSFIQTFLDFMKQKEAQR